MYKVTKKGGGKLTTTNKCVSGFDQITFNFFACSVVCVLARTVTLFHVAAASVVVVEKEEDKE